MDEKEFPQPEDHRQQTEERRRRFVKDRDYFQALYEVVKVVNASLDMTTVLEEIVKDRKSVV